MKRLCILLMCVMLAFPSFAWADYSLLSAITVAKVFDYGHSLSELVDSLADYRAAIWYAVAVDVWGSAPSFDHIPQDSLVFLIGLDRSNQYIQLFICDENNQYRHVTISPGWKVLIIDDAGVSLQEAQSAIAKLCKNYYGMMPEKLTEILATYASSNSQKATTVSSATSNISKAEGTNKASGLPSLKGSFSGEKMKVTVNKTTYTVRKDFKVALDKYRDYFDSYIDVLKSLDAEDPDYILKYANHMQEYLEVMQAMDRLEKLENNELTNDEVAYLNYVVTKINMELLSAMGN